MARRLLPGLLASLLFGIACGGKDPQEPQKPQIAEILSFEVSNTSVAWGEKVSISWQTKHAESVELKANGTKVDLGAAKPSSGSVEVEVRETTEFRFSATGGGRRVEADPVTVTVEGPRIVSFEASPDVIEEGEEVTLSWKTENAESVEIRDAAGNPVDLGGAPAGEGSVAIVPSASTTYTLRAIAGELSVEAEASVRVRGAPVLEVAASPTEIRYGEKTTLSWTMTEGETLRIERDGTVILETNDASGEFADEPSLTATYVFTATRADKSAVESVTVGVRPVILSFVTSDQPVPVHGSVEIQWHIGGAREVVLSNGADSTTIEVDSPDERSFTSPQGPEGKFTIVARSGSFEETAVSETPVLEPPVIGSFTASPEIVSANPGETARVTLIWAGVERAAYLVLRNTSKGLVDIDDLPLDAGSVEVEIDEDSEFELKAVNAAGETTASTWVRVVPFPSIDHLAATPRHVGSGEPFVLSWSTTNATSVSLTANGLPVAGVEEDDLSGSVELQIAVDTTYVLRAVNDAGDFVEETVTVTVGAPQILSFVASPSYAPTGGTVTFSWSNLGGSSLALEDGAGTAVHLTSDLDEIEEGDFSVQIPDEGLFDFTLRVTNGVGDQSTSTVTVVTSVGPRLLAFSGSKTLLTAGETITFAWEVQDDPFGETPQLTLTDGITNYDLSDANPNQGSKSFAIQNLGELTFTLTASTAAGTKTATHSATVHGAPQVTLSATPTVYDSTVPVTLSWTSEHAEGSLAIFRLDAQGQPIQPPIHTVPEAERDAGSFDIHPTENSTYRIVATNGIGATATAEASVTMAPPTILSFEAIPDEVVEGDEVTLSWTTRMATGVSLSVINGLVVEEVQEPFVDIRTMGAQTVTMIQGCGQSSVFAPTDEGCATITFPSGFTFPFGGVDRTSIVMHANGFLGFDTSAISSSFSNQPLSAQYPSVNIVPFWDDLVGNADAFHYLVGSDARGQYLITQWSEVVLFNNVATFSFQVVLWDDGAFEFRYGPGTGDAGRLAGNSATVGYRFPDGSESYTLHFGASSTNTGPTMPGGFSGRSWRFSRPSIEPNGSYVLTAPSEDLDVTLVATGPGGEAEAEISITIHPRAKLVVTAPTEELEAGDAFTIAWTTENADAVQIVGAGGVVCTATPAEVEQGSCTLSEPTPGDYVYTVRATGALGHVVEQDVELRIHIPISLDFQVSASEVQAGDSVTLSWTTTGADSISLTANGVELLDGSEPMDTGSLVHQPQDQTTYTFTLTAADGRTRTVSHTVRVHMVEVDGDTPAMGYFPGESIPFSWEVTPIAPGSPLVYGPMEEVSSSFFDIRNEPGAVQLIGGGNDETFVSHTFEGGFTFPYFGEVFQAIRVSTNGFVSFASSGGESHYKNWLLPHPTNAKRVVHLAPFWDDLHTRSSGRVHALAASDGSYVIQWSGMSKFAGSSNSNEYDLNFQVVLFPNGAFEFRYGTMAPPPNSSSSCFPNPDCSDDANGASATIGYQNLAATAGNVLHYGGAEQEATNVPMPGGLANRSFRVDPTATPLVGSKTFTAGRQPTASICAVHGSEEVCESARFHVATPGWLQITELMLQPAAGEAQWFEVQNLLPVPVDLEGLVIESDGGSHVVGQPLVVPPRGFVTFSSGPATGFTADYVFNGVPLSAGGDSLSISMNGTKLAEVSWDSTWPLVAGQSLELDWRAKRVNNHLHTAASSFCPRSESYDGGANAGTPGWDGGSCEAQPYVAYNFTDAEVFDIQSTGEVLLSVYISTATVDLSFAFPYFGTTTNQLWVGSQGFVTVTSSSDSTSNATLPGTSSPRSAGIIAPMWDDFSFARNNATVKFEERTVGGQQVAIFDWHRLSPFAGLAGDSVSFQLQLWEDGRIVFAYREILDVNSANYGSSATIGFQEPTADPNAGYMLYSHNQRSIAEGQVIEFVPVAP